MDSLPSDDIDSFHPNDTEGTNIISENTVPRPILNATSPLTASAAVPKPQEEQRIVLRAMFCGAIAGIVAKTAVAPLERIKMSFQISQEQFSFSAAYNRGAQFIRKGGILSLWKGHSTTVLRVAPYAGISYASHDYAEKTFKSMMHTSVLPFQYKFLAGSIAGECHDLC